MLDKNGIELKTGDANPIPELKAILEGREIVIISPIQYDNTAIFYYENGSFYTFTRSFGVFERNDIDKDRFTSHIENMKREGAQVFIRGYSD